MSKITNALVTLLALSVSGICQAEDSVTIQLRWLHQFQFAGYYMALEKGYYEEAGLDVKLLEGGPSALKPLDELMSGRSDFAITSSGVVIDRMEGKPVQAVAAIMQTSPIVWITLKSANIQTVEDMAGKRAMLMPPPESAELLTVLRKDQYNNLNVEFQHTSFDVEDLIRGKTDAYDGYISNEPYVLTQQGVEYNLINPRDYGVNFYADVLVTRESLADRNPELVARVRDASLKGWEYALTNLEKSVQVIHEKYAPEKSIDHLRFEARTLRRLILPDLLQLGHMNPARWQFIADSYRDLGMTSADPALEGFLFEDRQPGNYWLAIKVGGISAVLLMIAGYVILKFRRLSQQLAQTNRKLSEIAIIDQLTHVHNRNGLQQLIPGMLSLANRDGMNCSFLMLDIDHFKSVNDRFGHQTGDVALQAFAEVLTRHRRKEDLVARVGGEEFVMLLVGAHIEAATQIANQILESVRQLELVSPDGGRFGITASIGLVPAKGTLEGIWYAADTALYQAKHEGRDRVVRTTGVSQAKRSIS